MSQPPTTDSVRAEYLRRRDAASAATERLAGTERRISHGRLAVFVLLLALGFGVFGVRRLDAFWLAPPALLFAVLVVVHDRTIRHHERVRRRYEHYEWALARVEERWTGLGSQGDEHRPERHAYAEDLDLFGEGSLFELLCQARTPGGRERLASWLLAPAPPSQVRLRQAAVAELAPRLDLRESLAATAEDARARLVPGALAEWTERPSRALSVAWNGAAAALSALSLAGLAAWIWTSVGALPFVGALAVQSAFHAAVRSRVAETIRSLDRPLPQLRSLASLLAVFEHERFESSHLVQLASALESEGLPPSRQVARLQRFVDLLDARRNQLFAPIAALLGWGTQIALAAERWRVRHGAALLDWHAAASELEALASLSAYAHEHPQDCYPEIDEQAPAPRYEAHDLGHPLLPDARCVRNELLLGGESGTACFVVSGSNMSGKSTFLRSVGVSAVMAFCGAPVRAAALALSPLEVAASIRVRDSLREGRSHFQAEIERLRQIVEIAGGSTPALFLLDEILHGTNSHDRRIGADAVLRELVSRGAIGLVTTHDLALAAIAEEEGDARFANVHFEDCIVDGVMSFDYRLRDGVVRRSNALELMRAVGLPV